MGDTWIADMRHYLDDNGDIAVMPMRAMNLALFFGAIVSWMTKCPPEEIELTNVRCRRSPGGFRCTMEIIARFDDNGESIVWECPICGDNGRIRGWQGTHWDRSSDGAGSNEYSLH